MQTSAPSITRNLAAQFDEMKRPQDGFEARLSRMSPIAALYAIEAHVISGELSRVDGLTLYFMHAERLSNNVTEVGARIQEKG